MTGNETNNIKVLGVLQSWLKEWTDRSVREFDGVNERLVTIEDKIEDIKDKRIQALDKKMQKPDKYILVLTIAMISFAPANIKVVLELVKALLMGG